MRRARAAVEVVREVPEGEQRSAAVQGPGEEALLRREPQAAHPPRLAVLPRVPRDRLHLALQATHPRCQLRAAVALRWVVRPWAAERTTRSIRPVRPIRAIRNLDLR